MSDYYQENFPLKSVAVTNSPFDATQLDHDDATQLAFKAAYAAEDRKAGDVVLLRLADVSYIADYFVVATGYSRVQVRAIADAVEEQIKLEMQRAPLRIEGREEGNWVLYDYGDVIVHVMMPKEREFYNLEAFWGHAERIEFTKD